jgi:NodT family efflux transporter outer membrane factor (OMF) lipoprotein
MLLAVACCAGCAVGPSYQHPASDTPKTWAETLEGGSSAKPFVVERWWETLNDQSLNSLIDRAVKSNHDLRIAEARLREARAARDVTAGDLWPAIMGTGSFSRTRSSRRVKPGGLISTTEGAESTAASDTAASDPATSGTDKSRIKTQTDLWQAGFDASWEIDIFGGTRRAVEAAEADADAARELHRDVLVSLLGEVATNYVELRGLQQRLAITNNNITTQTETFEITRELYTAGLTSEIDALRAESLLRTTESQVPTLESLIKRSIHRLGVLLGCQPGALLSELSQEMPIPVTSPEIPVGLPSDLLRRRPDVRAAERQLAAATARTGVAVADLFPRFSLTGSFGRQGDDARDLKIGVNRYWKIGPSVKWPVFEGGKLLANIKVQNARQEQATAQYEKTVLTSFEEVENALVDYSREQIRFKSLAEAAEANRMTVGLSKELYTKGLTDFLNVLDAERSLYSSEDQLVQSRQIVVLNLIALYKALGGGWEAFPVSEQVNLNP